ncbi:hypothetical protein DV735_g1039, partial [Chaetothyriales sp. CBS 134920]
MHAAAKNDTNTRAFFPPLPHSADAAAKGPKQSPEEARAPPTIKAEADEVVEKVVKEAGELGRDAQRAIHEAEEKVSKEAKKVKATLKADGQKLSENRDNPVVVGNAVVWTIATVAIAVGAYHKHAEGKLDWQLAGTVAGAVAAFGNTIFNSALKQSNALRKDLDAFAHAPAAASPALQGQISTTLTSLSRTIEDYQFLTRSETNAEKKDKAEERLKNFKADLLSYRAQFDQLKKERDAAINISNRNELLGRRPHNAPTPENPYAHVSSQGNSAFAPADGSAPTSNNFTAEEQALREQNFFQAANSQLDEFLDRGRAVLGDLGQQREILKGTQKKLYNVANTLGSTLAIMSQAISDTFARCKAEKRPALVAYFTCGYPTIEDTVDIMLGMQAGGVDIIEVGIAFTDPIADGPTIQKANTVALANGVTTTIALEQVRKARKAGLRVPIIFMGYYNPLLRYGEDKMLRDCQQAGVNGFIMVDLPPEEAVKFRQSCRKYKLSYVPLIAPSTSDKRMKLLCKIADSFIYVVSRMGVTGATGSLNTKLPDLLARVHQYSGGVPAAVGFGVSTREHFQSVGSIAEGVVIGSQIVTEMGKAATGQAAKAVQDYCSHITGRTVEAAQPRPLAVAASDKDTAPAVSVDSVIRDEDVPSEPGLADQLDALNAASNGTAPNPDAIPSRFGQFGGQYVPESLMDCLAELEAGFSQALNDPKFWEEYRSYYPYMGRPSSLHPAPRLSEAAGGRVNIYLKREDLNHTGSHKINNALGQILIARRLGKTRIIAETGAGQHGVATATVCAKFGMPCTIYMGAEDVRRQALNVFRIKLLGAQVVAVEAGSRTLRDAVNEALRAWVVDLDTTHYVIGSAIGPHPFPTIVRTFQSVIGKETKEQMKEQIGRLPDAVVACVGGGSNAVGMFYPFSNDPSVKLVGVEAAGDGINTGRHSATLLGGSIGVLHGVRTYILQNEHGQVADTHSVSAGLDYPGVGPELSSWKDSNRARFLSATDAEALIGFRTLSQTEGIIPALESSHAIWGAMQLAKELAEEDDKNGNQGEKKNIVICLSGRGDKDVESVAEKAGIPCTIWFEDALAYHGVPTDVFSLYILVADIEQAREAMLDTADWYFPMSELAWSASENDFYPSLPTLINSLISKLLDAPHDTRLQRTMALYVVYLYGHVKTLKDQNFVKHIKHENRHFHDDALAGYNIGTLPVIAEERRLRDEMRYEGEKNR